MEFPPGKLYDRDGQLRLTETEALAEKLRSVGIDPKSQALLSVNVPLEDIFIHIRAVSDRPVYDIGIEQQKLLEEIEQVRRSLDLDQLEREDYIQRLRAAMWDMARIPS